MNESNQPGPEDKLIIALKAGDNLAFKQVYREGYTLVETLILKNGGKAEDAEDIFQEVLFVIVKKLREPNFQLSCAINTFLYSVARNLWKNHNRNKKPLAEFKDSLHDFEDPGDMELTIKRLFEQKHEIMVLALEKLSDKCKQLIVGFYAEKKSLREIALELQVKEEGVRVQKHRCMGYLADKVQEHPDYQAIKEEES